MHDNSTSISQPTLQDVDGLANLFLSDMKSLNMPVTFEDMRSLALNVVGDVDSQKSGAVCWVAKVDGDPTPVGVILANTNWSLKFAGLALWIEELYVAESARRRGIGRILVEHLLEYADTEGYAGIDLEAYQGNAPASILYRSLGFHRLGRERFYYRMGPEERF